MKTTTHSNSGKFVEDFKEQLNTFSIPDRLSNKYTIYDCLKYTSDKEIYMLTDKDGSFYLLKKGSGKLFFQIQQEQKILTALNNEGDYAFPKCIDYWEENDTCYLLRTYIEGISLADYFERRLYLTDLEITGYMLDVCNLILLLHSQNPPIIHRDIKPENFIVQKGTGKLYLIDFDTARIFSPDKSRDTYLIGTPSHAAPEQFGFSQSDFRTDIYNIGKTILYLATGTTEETALQNNTLSKPLQKITKKCIAFTPGQRYSDIKKLQKDLKRYNTRLAAEKPGTQLGTCIMTIITILALSLTGYHYIFEHLDNGGNNQNTASGSSGTANHNIASDLSEDADQNTASGSTEDADPDSASGSTKDANQNTDLRSQTGAGECDIWQYQEQLDSIILAYYYGENDEVIEKCEALVGALYNNNALMHPKKEDYSKMDSLPDNFWSMNEIDTIQVRLAYRDQILYTHLGQYSDYAYSIINAMAYELKPTNTPNPPSCLYLYATSTPGDENTENNYGFALSDLLNCISNGFDTQDGFISPQ